MAIVTGAPRTPEFDVVHVSIVHTWDDTRIFRRECRSLASAGRRVALVAVGAVTERVDDVTVVGFPAYGSRLRRVVRGLPRMAQVLRRVTGRVYHLHDPELLVLAPALRSRGARVVYDAHEDLPSQMLGKDFPLPGARRAFSLIAVALCGFAGLVADRVVAATTTVANRFPRSRTHVVRNLPELLEAIDDSQDYDDRARVAVYVGGITEGRGVREMIEAGRRGLPDGWLLQLVGPQFPPGLLDDVLDDHEADVVWEGELAPLEARKKIAAARMGLVVLQPTKAYVDALPTKLFEYMAAGLPVIASDFPLWRQIVEGERCGLLVDPLDVEQIARAMTHLAEHPQEAREMGARGRRAVRERLNWGAEEHALLELYAGLDGPAGGARAR